MSDELGELLTIGELARRVGWTATRMRRHLQAKNDECGGVLLANVGRGSERPRFVVSIAKLRELSPEFFGRSDPGSVDTQLEWLTEQVEDLRARLDHAHRRIDLQTARIVELVRERRRAG